MSIEKGISARRESDKKVESQKWFQQLIQPENLVGDLYSINYETARVIIHDKHRHDVGGIPSLSFLIASRIDTNNSDIDFKAEDTSFILLRVKDAAALPQDKEAERIRVETAQRISGETDKNWDDASSMDVRTKNLLSFAGVECRIIGTFFLEENSQDSEAPLILKFGSDISNYYSNKGFKVYKPNGKALELIVNYSENIQGKTVKLGQVRYASTNRKYQQIDDVPVYIYPADLLSQKSALFGMTRTGKSNTTKIIAKSVFELRKGDNPLRIGQIIFDPNGEYANENVQDNNSALKNVWQLLSSGQKEDEVVTYGITPHPNDPDRIRMLLNFYLDENLPVGKEIINSLLYDDTTTYIKNFLQVNLEKPDENDNSAMRRYKRRVLAYRSVLARAGFPVPKKLTVSTKSLFNKDLLSAMGNSTSDNSAGYQSAAKVFGTDSPTLQQLAGAFESLDKFIRENKEYKNFETEYVQKSKSGNTWADEDLKKIIGIFQYPNGTRKIGKAVEQHSADTTSDYAEDIYNHLIDGKLVIIDQSTGEPDLNKSSADRIM
ncbi:MAG: ATP-binding protein, partial [Bacteroidales bacterium]|nr:ATP-binding protein [Bacteroidales bacterium]